MHLSSARFVIAHGPKPALRSHREQNAAASPASRPASVTIGIRSSVGWDGEGCRDVSTKQGNEKFCETGLDRWNQNYALRLQVARVPIRGPDRAQPGTTFVSIAGELTGLADTRRVQGFGAAWTGGDVSISWVNSRTCSAQRAGCAMGR